MDVTRSQNNDTLLAGSQLTIFCDIAVNPNVDTNFNVDINLTRTDSENMIETIDSAYGRVRIHGPDLTVSNQYQSRIEFKTLSTPEDPGLYRCEVEIDSDSDYSFVFDSEDGGDTTTFNVIGECSESC